MFGQPEDRAIVRGVIEIAHSLGKTVTADGVETVEQVDLLRHMKCDLLQGWYFSKACAVGRLSEVLQTMPKIGPARQGSRSESGISLTTNPAKSRFRRLSPSLLFHRALFGRSVVIFHGPGLLRHARQLVQAKPIYLG